MFKASPKALAAAMSRVMPIVERRCTIPILTTIRFVVADGRLTLTSSNLDMEMQTWLDVDGGDATFAASPHRLYRLLSQLGGADAIEIVSEPTQIDLAWRGGHARLPTLPGSDFPDMDIKLDGPWCDLPSSFARDVLQRVSPFISSEETRYYLNGVCLDREGVAVATDGHRLAAMPLPDGVAKMLAKNDAIIPRDFVKQWVAATAGQDAQLSVRPIGKEGARPYAAVSTEQVRIVGKLIDGVYPNWRRVIPDPGKQLSFDRAPLLLAMRRVQTMRVERTQYGTFVTDGVPISIEAKSLAGEAISVLVDGASGKLDDLASFNVAYMLAAFEATKGAKITLDMVDPASPALIRGSEDDLRSRVIVMPSRDAQRAFEPAPSARAA